MCCATACLLIGRSFVDRRPLATLLAICLLVGTASGADDGPIPLPQVNHPRLLFTAADQVRIASLSTSDPQLDRLVEQTVTNAERMLDEPVVRYQIPDGLRLLGQSRYCLGRVLTFAMAYRMAGDQRFADAAVREMHAAAAFDDWNSRHFLDVAEMTTALAIGYDWLYDAMSEADRQTIREAIVRHGLLEGKKVYDEGGWWVTRANNWNQVCNGGLILGALAVAEDEPDLYRQIMRAGIDSMPVGLSRYAPDGAYPEGPGYWEYGTSYTCLTLSALQTALDNTYAFEHTEGLARTGWFFVHAISPTDAYFNFADCHEGTARSVAAIHELSALYHAPVLSGWQLTRLDAWLSGPASKSLGKFDRFFPLEIAWYPAAAEATATMPLDGIFDGEQDVAMMRSAWGDRRAAYVGFKAGDNRASHGHLDVGSFVYEVNGIRWAIDLGSDNYNMPGYFSNPQRWKYYRLNNRSHNTLTINNQLQDTKAHCDLVRVASQPDYAAAIADMTAAYRGQATRVRRGIEFCQRQSLHVRDELSGVDGTIRWAMVTGAEVQLDGARARLRQRGEELVAEILEPADARFEVLPNTPPTLQENSNAGTRVLAISVRADPADEVAISVLLQPPGSKPFDLPPRPLDDWPTQAMEDVAW